MRAGGKPICPTNDAPDVGASIGNKASIRGPVPQIDLRSGPVIEQLFLFELTFGRQIVYLAAALCGATGLI